MLNDNKLENVEYVDIQFPNLFCAITSIQEGYVTVLYEDGEKKTFSEKRFREIYKPAESPRKETNMKKPKITMFPGGGVKVDCKKFFEQPEVQRKERAMIELDITGKRK